MSVLALKHLVFLTLYCLRLSFFLYNYATALILLFSFNIINSALPFTVFVCVFLCVFESFLIANTFQVHR